MGDSNHYPKQRMSGTTGRRPRAGGATEIPSPHKDGNYSSVTTVIFEYFRTKSGLPSEAEAHREREKTERDEKESK